MVLKQKNGAQNLRPIFLFYGNLEKEYFLSLLTQNILSLLTQNILSLPPI